MCVWGGEEGDPLFFGGGVFYVGIQFPPPPTSNFRAFFVLRAKMCVREACVPTKKIAKKKAKKEQKVKRKKTV